jgi:hypothetical protein
MTNNCVYTLGDTQNTIPVHCNYHLSEQGWFVCHGVPQTIEERVPHKSKISIVVDRHRSYVRS